MIELTFNFIGVNATDFRRAFVFYSEDLGVRPALPTSPDDADSWAMLVAGWDESVRSDRRGLRCELFERDLEPPDDRWWGHNQNVRPSIQVTDLAATKDALHGRGVTFTGPIEDTDWGQVVEFEAPDGIRWSLAQTPDDPVGQSLETPFIGWVELKTADLAGQHDFYTQVMGLTNGDRSASRIRLEQGAGEPRVYLEPGGERVTVQQGHDSPFVSQPVWMSFETPDIDEASVWLTEQDVELVRGIKAHEWGGRDLLIQDDDGNPVQIVEYEDQ